MSGDDFTMACFEHLIATSHRLVDEARAKNESDKEIMQCLLR